MFSIFCLYPSLVDSKLAYKIFIFKKIQVYIPLWLIRNSSARLTIPATFSPSLYPSLVDSKPSRSSSKWENRDGLYPSLVDSKLFAGGSWLADSSRVYIPLWLIRNVALWNEYEENEVFISLFGWFETKALEIDTNGGFPEFISLFGWFETTEVFDEALYRLAVYIPLWLIRNSPACRRSVFGKGLVYIPLWLIRNLDGLIEFLQGFYVYIPLWLIRNDWFTIGMKVLLKFISLFGWFETRWTSGSRLWTGCYVYIPLWLIRNQLEDIDSGPRCVYIPLWLIRNSNQKSFFHTEASGFISLFGWFETGGIECKWERII